MQIRFFVFVDCRKMLMFCNIKYSLCIADTCFFEISVLIIFNSMLSYAVLV